MIHHNLYAFKLVKLEVGEEEEDERNVLQGNLNGKSTVRNVRIPKSENLTLESENLTSSVLTPAREAS